MGANSRGAYSEAGGAYSRICLIKKIVNFKVA